MKKKKKIMIGVLILLVGMLLFLPIPTRYKDGGSIEYKALTYKITKYNSLDNHYKSGYKKGLEIEILGKTIYKNMESPTIENYNETMERIVKIEDELYYEVKNQFYFSCEESKNKITSIVNQNEIPTENNQANFESDSYTFVYKKNIVKVCNPSKEESIFLKRKNIKEEKEELIVNEDQSIDIDTDFIKTLYNKVNPSNDANVVKEMFRDTKKFSNKYLIATGLLNVIKEKEYLNEEYISDTDVENSIKKIFGDNITFTHEDAYILGQDIYQEGVCGYWYRSESKNYQLMHGCGGNQTESFRRKLISARKDREYIYLKEKSIYIYHEWDIGIPSEAHIYNNVNQEKLIYSMKIEANEPCVVNIEDYIDEASTYVYVFKKVNDNYILEKIDTE